MHNRIYIDDFYDEIYNKVIEYAHERNVYFEKDYFYDNISNVIPSYSTIFDVIEDSKHNLVSSFIVFTVKSAEKIIPFVCDIENGLLAHTNEFNNYIRLKKIKKLTHGD